MFKRFVLIGLIIVSGALLGANLFGASIPAVGSAAPGFTLNSQDGNPVSLSQFRGKWVVLYFYPRDMTSGCTIEAHNFQRDQEKFKAANAVVLGVSVDDTKSHQQFCTKGGLTFKLLSDTDHKVSEEYGSLTNLGLVKFSRRHTFIIDPQGKIVQEYPDVDANINQHSEQVLSELAQLQKKG
ncbi:MAG TPA: peroxiredoxin [Terriglobales bacterium]